MSCTKARLRRLLNTIMKTLLANSSWSTKITGNANCSMHDLILLYEYIIYLPHLFLISCFMQYRVFSCRDAYDCTPDPAMEGLAIRLYEITIEGSDAAGNVGRDQCRVIIISSNMTIQDADAIVPKSSVRFPVATTTDMGIMLETKTNIILRYVYDVGQEIIKQSGTNKARERDLMVAGEARDPTMLNENTMNNSNYDPRKMAEVEIWKFVAAVAVGICVGMVVGAKL